MFRVRFLLNIQLSRLGDSSGASEPRAALMKAHNNGINILIICDECIFEVKYNIYQYDIPVCNMEIYAL